MEDGSADQTRGNKCSNSQKHRQLHYAMKLAYDELVSGDQTIDPTERLVWRR